MGSAPNKRRSPTRVMAWHAHCGVTRGGNCAQDMNATCGEEHESIAQDVSKHKRNKGRRTTEGGRGRHRRRAQQDNCINLHLFFSAAPVGATVSLCRCRVICRGFQHRVPVLRAHSLSPAGGEERVINLRIFFAAALRGPDGPKDPDRYLTIVLATKLNLFGGLESVKLGNSCWQD